MTRAKKLPLAAGLIAIAGIGIATYLGATLLRIATSGAPESTAKSRPNLLFITLDTCRADHLNAYGYGRETSPHLARMAQDGFVFTNAFTVATYSAPSHATMFTGLYPLQHGLIDNGLELSDEVTPLAELMEELRYQTAAFVGYHVLGDETDLDRGFETFELHKVESHKHSKKSLEREVAGFRAAREWLEEWHRSADNKAGSDPGSNPDAAPQTREPFFLWLHSQQIHQSYDPPPPYDTLFLNVPHDVEVRGVEDFELRCSNDVRKALKRDRLTSEMMAQVEALYDGEIRLVDDELEYFFEFLRRAGIYDETMIVVTSDHGEHLFEETEVDFGRGRFLHGQTYFDTVMRIPLIIKPATGTTQDGTLQKAGSRPEVTTSTVDLLPTVMELLGLEPPAALPGRSLVPWMKNPEQGDSDTTVYFQESPNDNIWLGIRTAEWKFLRKVEEDETSRWLLHLQTDPEEHHNVYEEHREVAAELEKHLDDWLSKQHAVTPSSREDMSEQMREALRKAGYLRDAEPVD